MTYMESTHFGYERQQTFQAVPTYVPLPFLTSCEHTECRLNKHMMVHRFEAGDTIQMRGRGQHRIYLMLQGTAALSTSLPDGRTQILRLAMPTDFIGRLGSERVQHDATALSDVTACSFSRSDFESLIWLSPEMTRRLLHKTLKELDEARDWLLVLGRKTAVERVASFLRFLEKFAALKADQRILIVGASGGVGIYAVQIARTLGAHVTGISGPYSQTLVSSLGADETLNYQAIDLSEIHDRFDVILDTVGVVSPRQARRLLRRDGLFLPLNVGFSEILAAILNPFFNRKTRLAVNPNTAKDLHQLAEFVRNEHVRPVIDTIYPLSNAAAAHAHVETRHRKGAIVLTVEYKSVVHGT